MDKNPNATTRTRLEELQEWHDKFKNKLMFHPFMSDIVGNTICADLLDYLPRDRLNLGMEHSNHGRLQRYLTIREGKLYPAEGLRLSIMVIRAGRGGQRRDVATAVLDIMRERYEMAERVYYHHKKAAASAMLAKLAELCVDARPKDGDDIYPAPWTNETALPTNIVHFSDLSLIEYFGNTSVNEQHRELQSRLYIGLRYDRKRLYRTLLVVDTGLINMSTRPISYFAKDLREYNGKPSNKGRQKLEEELSQAANAKGGDVLVYCPSPDMQAKEVDARLEIIEDRVLPLSVQRESFTYHADLTVIEQYYQELWRMYIFVASKLFKDAIACKAIVDRFCELYGIEKLVAYGKVREYEYKIKNNVIASRALKPLSTFLRSEDENGLPFADTPQKIVAAIPKKVAEDDHYLKCVETDTDPFARIASLFDIVILETELEKIPEDAPERTSIVKHIETLKSGKNQARMAARIGGEQFAHYEDYRRALLKVATGTKGN